MFPSAALECLPEKNLGPSSGLDDGPETFFACCARLPSSAGFALHDYGNKLYADAVHAQEQLVLPRKPVFRNGDALHGIFAIKVTGWRREVNESN
jgi:hypothetical protein